MSSTLFTPDEIAAMREEHATIFSALKLVRRGIAMIDPDAPNPEVLAAQVRTWRTRLKMHLLEEERLGLHDRIAVLVPDATHELEALRAQHAEILRGLEVIGGRLEEGKVIDFGVVRDRLDAIETLWCRHERAEDSLVAAAMGDTGESGDSCGAEADGDRGARD